MGFKRSGKTSLGQSLADKFKCPFIDTDDLLETMFAMEMKTHLSCREILLQHGEAAFRAWERKVLQSLMNIKGVVISLGGGSLSKTTRHLIPRLGHLIYLKLPKEEVKRRLMKAPLPSYLTTRDPDSTFEGIYQERHQLFEAYANETVCPQDLEQGFVDAI